MMVFKKEFSNFFRLSLLLLLLCLICYKLLASSGIVKEEILCDLESIVEVNGKLMFSNGDYLFDNANCIDSSEAISGKHSLLLSPACPFGMTTELPDIKEGDLIEVKVSCKRKTFNDKSSTVCIVVTSPDFYLSTSEKDVPAEACGWFTISKQFRIPWTDKPVRFYCWNPGQDQILVDDFKIVRPNIKVLLREG